MRSPVLLAVPFLFRAGILTAQPPVCRDASAAVSRRDLPAAERLLRQCTAAAPFSVDAWLQLCGVYQAQGNAEALFQTASQAMRRFPAEKRFYLTAGNHLGRTRQFARAVQVLGAASARWPQDPQVLLLLSGAEFGLGTAELDALRNESAERHLRRAAELNPNDAEARLNLGRALHNLNRFADALAAFDQARSIDPDAPLLRFHRSLAYLALGEFASAAGEAGREIASGSDYPPSYLVRGQALFALGEFDQALPDLRAAARRMPDNARARFAEARCLLQLGMLPDGEASLRAAMALDPSDPAPVNLLAGLLLRNGRAAEAAPLLDRAAELSRNQRLAAPGEIRFRSAGAARP